MTNPSAQTMLADYFSGREPDSHGEIAVIMTPAQRDLLVATLLATSAPAAVPEALERLAHAVIRDISEAKRRLDANRPKDGPVHPVSAFLTGLAIDVGKARAALATPKEAFTAASNGKTLAEDCICNEAERKSCPACVAPSTAAGEAVAAALARRLCQIFDGGGESQRSARARHASAIFQLLNRDAPQFLAEQNKCDADPVAYLETVERGELAAPPAAQTDGVREIDDGSYTDDPRLAVSLPRLPRQSEEN